MSIAVAKKRKASNERPERPVREMAVGIRSTPEWKAWLDRFAESKRTTIVDLIDWSLEEFARSSGFEPPPKR